MLSAHAARGARPWTGDEYNEYIVEKYLEANLVIVGDIVSFVPRTVGKSDSVAPDGWTYHRTTNVIVCDAVVDSVLKGNYGDSVITFQSMPYTERSRSRLVRPSDSLHIMEMVSSFADGDTPGRVLQLKQYVLLLKKEHGTYMCIYDTRPKASVLKLFQEIEAEGEAYLKRFEPEE